MYDSAVLESTYLPWDAADRVGTAEHARRRPQPTPRPRHVVAVPLDYAPVFDGVRGWHYQPAPPAWWLAEQETLLEADERPAPALELVPPLQVPRTSCRPGPGPCRPRHEHASPKRAVR